MSDVKFWVWARAFLASMGFAEGHDVVHEGKTYVVDRFSSDGMTFYVYVHLKEDPEIMKRAKIAIPEPEWASVS